MLSDEYLKRGDILLYEFHHTAIALQDGRKAEKSRPAQVDITLDGTFDKDGQWWYADTPPSDQEMGLLEWKVVCIQAEAV